MNMIQYYNNYINVAIESMIRYNQIIFYYNTKFESYQVDEKWLASLVKWQFKIINIDFAGKF